MARYELDNGRTGYDGELYALVDRSTGQFSRFFHNGSVFTESEEEALAALGKHHFRDRMAIVKLPAILLSPY